MNWKKRTFFSSRGEREGNREEKSTRKRSLSKRRSGGVLKEKGFRGEPVSDRTVLNAALLLRGVSAMERITLAEKKAVAGRRGEKKACTRPGW